MTVVDASVVVRAITGPSPALAERLRRAAPLFAPAHLDLEVASAIRSRVRTGHLTALEGEQAVDRLLAAPVIRLPHSRLLHRIWELRHNLTVYDAAYAALAEAIGAVLLTEDGGLHAAPGLRCRVERP